MASAPQLRRRSTVDYKALHEGEALPIQNSKSIQEKYFVLPETYSVERLVWRKKSEEGEVFLVKWLGYHKNESTWEPISHLPEPMTESYLCPPVDSIRLERAALDFESAIQKRLSSRSSSVILSLELDIYRHVFETDQSVLVESEDQLKKLPLCANWSYKLKANGKGVRVSFPLRVSPKLMNRVMFIRVDGDKLKKVTVPEERCIVVCAIEPFV